MTKVEKYFAFILAISYYAFALSIPFTANSYSAAADGNSGQKKEAFSRIILLAATQGEVEEELVSTSGNQSQFSLSKLSDLPDSPTKNAVSSITYNTAIAAVVSHSIRLILFPFHSFW